MAPPPGAIFFFARSFCARSARNLATNNHKNSALAVILQTMEWIVSLTPDVATDPMEALARTALADPMVGDTRDRAQRIANDALRFGSEAVLISRIPGASHCALEGHTIADVVRRETDLPVTEIEVPPLIDSMQPTLRTRIEAMIETVKKRR